MITEIPKNRIIELLEKMKNFLALWIHDIKKNRLSLFNENEQEIISNIQQETF